MRILKSNRISSWIRFASVIVVLVNLLSLCLGVYAAEVQSGPLEIKKTAPGGKWTIIRLNYEISGATITRSEEYPDKDNNLYYERKLGGTVDSDKLKISGTAHVEAVFGAPSNLVVKVTEGSSGTGAELKKYEDKLSGDGDMKFNLVVPVSKDKTYSFSIVQSCSLNYGHSLTVEGILTPSDGAVSQTKPSSTPVANKASQQANPRPVQVAKPPQTVSMPKIIGDPEYVAKITEALNILKNEAPSQYEMVVKYIRVIEVNESGSGMCAWEEPPRFIIGKKSVEQFGPGSPMSPVLLAGVLVHDAAHSKLYRDYNSENPGSEVPSDVWTGMDAESKCVVVQYDAVKKLLQNRGGNDELLDEIKNSLKSEYWKVNIDKRWW